MLIASLHCLLISDPEIDGSAGSNRAPLNPNELIVNTDIEAAKAFLEVHRDTPTTQRNYTKEIERLILWAINVKAKPMSSLTFTDMDEFVEFLAHPEPIEAWSTRHKFPRESPEWRPFNMSVKPPEKEGDKPKLTAGLAPSSRLTAMASLESFFSWLIDYGYLIKNPMRQIKTRRKAVRASQSKEEHAKVERYLDEDMWSAFQEAIEMMPKEIKMDLDKYERAKFISSLMLLLAPRASELANGRMNDFKSEGKLWWWHVKGKGSKTAKVPVVTDMLQALIRYRTYLNLTPLPLDSDDSPLLRSVKDGSPITPRQLNLILDGLFEDAAKLLESKAFDLPVIDIMARAEFQTRAAKIRQASSHWGRHTSITYSIRSGVPKDIVQRNARHSDSKTTDSYTHEDEKHWHSESQKLHA
jgi:integrase